MFVEQIPDSFIFIAYELWSRFFFRMLIVGKLNFLKN